MTDRPVRRALLSVFDKTGLIDFATALARREIELLSTGGTAKALREAGLAVIDVASVTGAPEILDGRVKTLHPAIHGGLLARRDLPEHMATIERQEIPPIDLLAVNLYPFEATIASGAAYDQAVEMIDIGGPAMIRAAAKNHGGVTVVTDPADYGSVLADLEAGDGRTSLALRQALAARAFARTAAYDAAIAAWFAEQQGELLPERLTLAAERQLITRYGENPHQQAAFYRTGKARPGVATAKQVQGKELSYNNIADADAAFELVAEFEQPAIAIIKHANPCGVAMAPSLAEAYQKAFVCDQVSAFGGIVAANRPLDRAVAEAIAEVFTEVVIAPGADDEARAVLGAKANLRLLITDGMPEPAEAGLMVRSVAGGLLVQGRDAETTSTLDLKTVTQRQPSGQEVADLRFAFTVAKHVKSNAIVFAKDGATVGIGAGQMSRLDSVRIAREKAKDAATAIGAPTPLTTGSVIASDAFFPFADGIEAALDAGAVAVIQPGGSRRDDEVIAAADRADAAMLFTGRRHFRH
ncbi:MAG: bifunctional phosphoribosylaminoimidazolecarboxamide formyltransferase/IMP cyclohydrolase [Alphaproteobacteria bacterium]|nr:bifunctional phosphoribosylaminoimidazolecarboxamide formyltransferase/IMP cyclohydrolase [Alphaproteobacteria bacterium]